MSSSTVVSTAFTPVESPRRTLAPMSVTAQSPEAKKPPSKWPDEVKDYVRRSFDTENLIDGITRQDMELQLRETITEYAEAGKILNIDWKSHPLPQQIVQQRRAYYYSNQHQWNQAPTNPDQTTLFAAQTANANYPTNNKKRSFDEEQPDPARSTTPPWRKTGKNRALEDRITHTQKNHQTRAEKKLKKAQAMEPSSKFKEALDNRARRFNLDNSPNSMSHGRSSHDEQQERVPSGPIVGTSQEVFKSYFRLTRAPRTHEVRPQMILEEALRRLKVLWRQENNYNFVCDQLKSIRQDLTVQHIKNSFTVEVYQTHALIALEKGDLGEYNQCQTQLRALYSMKLGGRPAEFTAYRILYFIHTANRAGLNDILAELTPTDKSKPAINHALDVRSAVASGNYHKLFRLYLDCPNMGAYLMDMFVARERIFALAKMCRGYKNTNISSDFLAEELGFESYEDCQQFLEKNLQGESVSGYLLNVSGKFFLDSNAASHFGTLKKQFEKVDIKGQI